MQKKSIARFDETAENWDAKPTRVKLAHAVAQEIISTIPVHKKMTSLEFGCGTGLVGLELAPKLQHLTAIDTSANMLANLEQKMVQQNLSNITTRKIDLCTEPLPEKFDLIFSSMTLHHIPDIPAILSILSSRLNKDGYLALTDLDCEDGSFHSDNSTDTRHNGFNHKNLGKLLTKAGFYDITFKTIFTIEKERNNSVLKSYPVFLATARKT
jgi:predicted TPR repeat methyltransferase